MNKGTIYGLGLHMDGTDAVSSMEPECLVNYLLGGHSVDENHALRSYLQRRKKKYLDVIHGVNVKRLDSAGWGLVMHKDEDPAVLKYLEPLLKHRREQAGDLYRCICGTEGFNGKENKSAFLDRFNAGSGPVDPKDLPYYLLLVGSPEKIPFRFQTQLDVQFAVGRIYFDTLEEYNQYANSVVEAEKPANRHGNPSLALVSTNHDDATNAGHNLLIKPLQRVIEKHKYWTLQHFYGNRAGKDTLKHLVGGNRAVPLLVSLSHGLMNSQVIGQDDYLAKIHQGAPICPGLDLAKGFKREWILSPFDIDEEFQVRDLIWFNFSCFSAGTPNLEEYGKGGTRRVLAKRPFVAELPKRLLGHPNGGALAIVGHVERLWLHSFKNLSEKSHITAYRSALEALLDGYPVGVAVEYVNQRYAELAAELTELFEQLEWEEDVDIVELARLWVAHNDARGFMVLGDPAVRLNVDDKAS